MQHRSKIKDLTLMALFAALTAVGAFITIPVPPVPFSLQIFFAILAGALLGSRRGAISVAVYVLLGLCGLPVFTKGAGLSYIFQPTFGYLAVRQDRRAARRQGHEDDAAGLFCRGGSRLCGGDCLLLPDSEHLSGQRDGAVGGALLHLYHLHPRRYPADGAGGLPRQTAAPNPHLGLAPSIKTTSSKK